MIINSYADCISLRIVGPFANIRLQQGCGAGAGAGAAETVCSEPEPEPEP